MASKALKRLKEDYQALAELYCDDGRPLPRYETTATFLDYARANARPGILTTPDEPRDWSMKLKTSLAPLWTTASGDTIPITEMEESHLRNTISFLQRHLVSRWGNARYISETHRFIKALHYMLEEAQRRGLNV